MDGEIGLDVRGRACPVPVLELARALRGLRLGAVVRLQADDPAAPADIRAWCESTGNQLVELFQDGPQLTVWIRKTAAPL
jgi:TusA-related sulfurtransferase